MLTPTIALLLSLGATSGKDFECPSPAACTLPDPDGSALCPPRPRPLLAPLDPERAAEQSLLLEGQRFDVSEPGLTRVDGDVRLRQGARLLYSDSLIHDADKQRVEIPGPLRYQDLAVLLSARSGSVDTAEDSALLDGVEFDLLDRRGQGRAEQMERLADGRSRLRGATFSGCELDRPAWLVRATRLTLDHAEGVAQAENLRVVVGGVPIIALPYASFPIDDRRRSGFLSPAIGGSSDNGLDISIPYYFNLAPNYDLTVAPRLISDRGLMLGGEFRYLGRQYRGRLDGTWLPDDDVTGDDRGNFSFDHFQDFGNALTASVELRRASDRAYFEDFGESLSFASVTLLRSVARLSRQGRWWSASAELDDYQVIDSTISADQEPYARVPRLLLNLESPNLTGPVVGLRSELVHFERDTGVTGQRFDSYGYVAHGVERSWGFVRPEIGFRSTHYQLDVDEQSAQSSPSRSLPIVSVDSGLKFERALSLASGRHTQTLEPRLYYLYAPFRDQDELPIFDTSALTFSFGQLFRPNRYTGADRQINANQIGAALTTRLLEDASGIERLRASVGQIVYFDTPRVDLPDVPALDDGRSNLIGELNLRFDPRWELSTGFEWNPNLSRREQLLFRVQRRVEDGGVYNIAYRYRRSLLDQIDISALVPVDDRLKLLGRLNVGLEDNRTLEVLGGIEYQSCCVALRLLGRRYLRNQVGEARNAIYFELELKGLGSLGRSTEDLLSRAILGYSR